MSKQSKQVLCRKYMQCHSFFSYLTNIYLKYNKRKLIVHTQCTHTHTYKCGEGRKVGSEGGRKKGNKEGQDSFYLKKEKV